MVQGKQCAALCRIDQPGGSCQVPFSVAPFKAIGGGGNEADEMISCFLAFRVGKLVVGEGL